MKLSDTQGLILSKASQHESPDWPLLRTACPQQRATRCSAPCSRTACSPSARRPASTPASLGARTRTAPGSRSESPRPACARSASSRTRALRRTPPWWQTRRHGGAERAAPTAGKGALVAEAAQHAPAAPNEATCAEGLVCQDQPAAAPMLPGGTNLRQTAQAVLDAWDDDADRRALAGPWSASVPCWPSRDRRTRSRVPPSRARAPSSSRCSPCCAGRKVPPSPRSPRPPAGRRTRSAASSPG